MYMYVCMYVKVYICMYVCTLYMYVCEYVCISSADMLNTSDEKKKMGEKEKRKNHFQNSQIISVRLKN